MGNKQKRGPNLPDWATAVAAGIDPATGQPLRVADPLQLKENIKKLLRIVDEQDFVNRYTWLNLPANITSQELERLIYYKGQVCLFYNKDLEEFYFMPFALDGTIDFYGRYNTVHPVPMTSGTTDDEKAQSKAQAEYLSKIKLKVFYDVYTPEGDDFDYSEGRVIPPKNVMMKSCVILHDYTKQLRQNPIPRWQLNDPLLDVEAECIPMMRTSMIAGSGVRAMRVNDEDSAAEADKANKALVEGSLTGQTIVPIIGPLEFQELADANGTTKAQEYMLSMQALDNFRLSCLGLQNSGVFEKQSHMLESEQEMNQAKVGKVLQDGLEIRQNFCDIANSIWPWLQLDVICNDDPATNMTGTDTGADVKDNGGNDNENMADL